MPRTTLQTESIRVEVILHIAFELSHKEWKLAFGVRGKQPRIVSMPARDLMWLKKEISKTRRKFGLSSDIRTVSCYEAGRDGFWLHRHLVAIGVENYVVDSSSIEVDRRKRRVKTDRVDAVGLLTRLMRHSNENEKEQWSVVRVPSVADEDERRLHREYKRIQKEKISHSNRINSLLVAQGLTVGATKDFPQVLDAIVLHDGSKIGLNLKAELLREYDRWMMAHHHLREIEQLQRELLKKQRQQGCDSIKLKKVLALMSLCGIGDRSAWPLVFEFFWRKFDNRRQVGAAAGLTGTPYDSGGSTREQGISKAGNARIRSLLVELSWFWLRHQPDSRISQWWKERFDGGGKRMRRIGIVAVARRLLVELWRFLEFGEVPVGAKFKAIR